MSTIDEGSRAPLLPGPSQHKVPPEKKGGTPVESILKKFLPDADSTQREELPASLKKKNVTFGKVNLRINVIPSPHVEKKEGRYAEKKVDVPLKNLGKPHRPIQESRGYTRDPSLGPVADNYPSKSEGFVVKGVTDIPEVKFAAVVASLLVNSITEEDQEDPTLVKSVNQLADLGKLAFDIPEMEVTEDYALEVAERVSGDSSDRKALFEKRLEVFEHKVETLYSEKSPLFKDQSEDFKKMVSDPDFQRAIEATQKLYRSFIDLK